MGGSRAMRSVGQDNPEAVSRCLGSFLRASVERPPNNLDAEQVIRLPNIVRDNACNIYVYWHGYADVRTARNTKWLTTNVDARLSLGKNLEVRLKNDYPNAHLKYRHNVRGPITAFGGWHHTISNYGGQYTARSGLDARGS